MLVRLTNGLLSELKSYTVPDIENVIGKTNLTVGYSVTENAVLSTTRRSQGIRLTLEMHGTPHVLVGEGNGPIDAAVHALSGIGMIVNVRSYEERSMGSSGNGGNASACAFIEVTPSDSHCQYYGVGIDTNIVTASIRALLSGINRLEANACIDATQSSQDTSGVKLSALPR